MSEISPALTPEEWAESEFESHYGHHKTSLQIDHKGRVFVHDLTSDLVVILNEADGAATVLPKIIALAMHLLSLYGHPLAITREDVGALREVSARLREDGFMHDDVDSIAARIAALLPPEGA